MLVVENAHDVGKYRKFRPECANICKNVKKTGNFVNNLQNVRSCRK